MLMFIVVNFSVMFKNIGHIHLVILIRLSEFSSQKANKQKYIFL